MYSHSVLRTVYKYFIYSHSLPKLIQNRTVHHTCIYNLHTVYLQYALITLVYTRTYLFYIFNISLIRFRSHYVKTLLYRSQTRKRLTLYLKYGSQFNFSTTVHVSRKLFRVNYFAGSYFTEYISRRIMDCTIQ